MLLHFLDISKKIQSHKKFLFEQMKCKYFDDLLQYVMEMKSKLYRMILIRSYSCREGCHLDGR